MRFSWSALIILCMSTPVTAFMSVGDDPHYRTVTLHDVRIADKELDTMHEELEHARHEHKAPALVDFLSRRFVVYAALVLLVDDVCNGFFSRPAARLRTKDKRLLKRLTQDNASLQELYDTIVSATHHTSYAALKPLSSPDLIESPDYYFMRNLTVLCNAYAQYCLGSLSACNALEFFATYVGPHTLAGIPDTTPTPLYILLSEALPSCGHFQAVYTTSTGQTRVMLATWADAHGVSLSQHDSSALPPQEPRNDPSTFLYNAQKPLSLRAHIHTLNDLFAQLSLDDLMAVCAAIEADDHPAQKAQKILPPHTLDELLDAFDSALHTETTCDRARVIMRLVSYEPCVDPLVIRGMQERLAREECLARELES